MCETGRAKTLFSVGFRFFVGSDILTEIAGKAKIATGKEDDYVLEPRLEIFAGLWYSPIACYRGPRDCCKSDADMRQWYTKRVAMQAEAPGKVLTAYLRSIFVHQKLIIGVMDCCSERFYALLVNNSAGYGTTALKKACGNGQYGSPIDVGRVAIPVVPYIDEKVVSVYN